MTLEETAARITRGLGGRAFSGSMKFDCGADGVIVLADGAATTTDRDADCTIALSRENLGKLLSGKLNPMTGVVTGKMKVSGDLAVAMRLSKLLA